MPFTDIYHGRNTGAARPTYASGVLWPIEVPELPGAHPGSRDFRVQVQRWANLRLFCDSKAATETYEDGDLSRYARVFTQIAQESFQEVKLFVNRRS